ncbi:hypothetical protein [Tenacibaculum aiptasiae]|uniref:hypothetical protein n=2 Tax=Tenacibaculum aiptasiae TaxID=426481 RepID=UPI00232E8DD8|nr:hypothetical protein [Tenacibaculum aiptasiae]
MESYLENGKELAKIDRCSKDILVKLPCGYYQRFWANITDKEAVSRTIKMKSLEPVNKMEQFKILKQAADDFKAINDAADDADLRLHKVELYNERILFSHILFDFEDVGDNRIALEHARNCAYEKIIHSKIV